VAGGWALELLLRGTGRNARCLVKRVVVHYWELIEVGC